MKKVILAFVVIFFMLGIASIFQSDFITNILGGICLGLSGSCIVYLCLTYKKKEVEEIVV